MDEKEVYGNEVRKLRDSMGMNRKNSAIIMESHIVPCKIGRPEKKDAVLCASDDEVRCREGTDDKSIIKFRLK